ncbi:glycosyltransferase family 25 protein [Tianweitania sp. BSSL-BM11]|uniref:Glycosyltransferase family 25 protein n=1 Tax=Tianweitania aestuarii TaxID=2814886 RepID=A0ABS5RSW2_9HYPH|nr:glycosyltransferase family 25 protein [Tianweitania aestuarii]MBS9720135.1 glycosyltransferase family 25 protein [Tianweitania aestuarii]
MLIFLINLDRSPDRLAFMTAQLDALGLQAERLAAVEGNAIDLAPFAASGLRPGEVGCFLSHREAWRSLVSSGDAVALVLEDDVRLSEHLPGFLKEAASHCRGDDILKLDTSGRSIEVEAASGVVAETVRLARLCSEHTGTAGYIISAEAAATLLARSVTFSEPVDLFMFGKDAVASSSPRIFQAIPAVVAQEKRFQAVQGTAMGSVIRRHETGKTSVLIKIPKELRRWVRKLGRFAASVPRRVRGTHHYLRVPFA